MASPTPGPLPLEGVKVADFSWIIAGPMLTKYLAIYGADVVKVEAHVRPDRFRLQPPFLRKPSRQSSLPFADLNPSKRSLGLNLGRRRGLRSPSAWPRGPTSWWRILVRGRWSHGGSATSGCARSTRVSSCSAPAS